MLGLSRVDSRFPTAVTYAVEPFAGPSAGASTFKRGGLIVAAQGRQRITRARLLINTTATGATVDVAANANVTTVTLTIGGDTVATAASTAAVDLADGVEMTLTATDADRLRSDGDVILVQVATAALGEATQNYSFSVVIEAQPVA